MTKKTTNELLHELNGNDNINTFLKNNSDELTSPSLSDYLNQLLQEKNISKAHLAKNSGLDKHYVYHILAGLKKPSRNKVLALAITLQLSLNETKYLLKYAQVRELYIRDKWDILIIYSLNHNLSVQQTNELLDEFNTDILE